MPTGRIEPPPDHSRLLLEINNAVVSQLDLRELAPVTAARLREVLQHDMTGISLYDPEANQFRTYVFDLPDALPPIPEGMLVPLEVRLAAWRLSPASRFSWAVTTRRFHWLNSTNV